MSERAREAAYDKFHSFTMETLQQDPVNKQIRVCDYDDMDKPFKGNLLIKLVNATGSGRLFDAVRKYGGNINVIRSITGERETYIAHVPWEKKRRKKTRYDDDDDDYDDDDDESSYSTLFYGALMVGLGVVTVATTDLNSWVRAAAILF